MNSERLQKLATFLRTVPPERFNLAIWGDTNFHPKHCGSAACACGWATALFDELKFDKGDIIYPIEDGYFCDSKYGNYNRNSIAIRDFFGLNSTELCYLFMSVSYYDGCETTPAQVANRIEDFLVNGVPRDFHV